MNQQSAARVKGFNILLPNVVIFSLLVVQSTSGASSCPDGQYYNNITMLCDPCPSECMKNPPATGMSEFMRRKCQDLATECSPPEMTEASTLMLSSTSLPNAVSRDSTEREVKVEVKAEVKVEDKSDDPYGHKAAGGIVVVALLLLFLIPVCLKLNVIQRIRKNCLQRSSPEGTHGQESNPLNDIPPSMDPNGAGQAPNGKVLNLPHHLPA